MASYLALDLEIDWRKGADWFESVLHDYDVASNWGNWMSAAGMTNGGRISHFNTLKQSKVKVFRKPQGQSFSENPDYASFNFKKVFSFSDKSNLCYCSDS